MAGDGQFSIRVAGETVMPGFVVSAGPFDRGIILSDVEVDGPGSQLGGESCQRVIETPGVRPIPIRWQERILGRVVAESIQKRVGHVGLEAQ